MRVFKSFNILVFRQKWVILSYLGIFVLISLLNTNQLATKTLGFQQTLPRVALFQESSDPKALAFEAFLKKETRNSEFQTDQSSAKESLYQGYLDAFVIIPEDFSVRLASGEPPVLLTLDERQEGAHWIRQKIEKYFLFSQAQKKALGQEDPAALQAALAAEPIVKFTNGSTTTSKERIERYYATYFKFTAYILVAIFILVFGNIMREYSEPNVLRRNSIIPMSSTKFQLQLMAGQLIVSLFFALFMVVIAFFMQPSCAKIIHWAAHAVNVVAFALAALGLTFLINAITRNRYVHSGLSVVLSLGFSFISGVMIPKEFLSPAVLTVSRFFPMAYYVDATDNIIAHAPFLQEVGIQLLFALAFTALGLAVYRLRQREGFSVLQKA
ncbi:hypothetical protein ABB02_00582 [Clostridiaceae bacterium JG1575]|nr:hypothetical protein ABB02_00582 [Clostridiaceae bacterium JG1575]